MDCSDAEQLASALRSNADYLLSGRIAEDDLEQRLVRICHGVVAALPGAKWAAMTIDTGAGLECHGATDDRVPALVEVMGRCGHGPCVDTLASATAEEIVVADLVEEQDRWPGFAPAAIAAGMRSVVCVAMAPDDHPAKSLSAWSDEPGAFADPWERTVMAAFVTQAAIAVYGAQRAAHLTRALATRDVIGRAKGILMERFSLGDDDAFGLLVRSSQDINMKLHDVAEFLCRDVETRAAHQGPPHE
ncbi:ANTAR domain-containing protein [Pseudonocardia ammonioxydans]|uniref:ANTAR domain-containing protein n=1 Tax=Pseudonocardia ammonioxydans TaxID=260086 RepID=A0A1I5HKT5_PSUAM|nr:ANTAR domain-containing protein [Pseudonocardia ammonioxydans]SFO48894.1 ANTAR domain-containing protein [Pseudonocardia ammonioxydans]